MKLSRRSFLKGSIATAASVVVPKALLAETEKEFLAPLAEKVTPAVTETAKEGFNNLAFYFKKNELDTGRWYKLKVKQSPYVHNELVYVPREMLYKAHVIVDIDTNTVLKNRYENGVLSPISKNTMLHLRHMKYSTKEFVAKRESLRLASVK